MPSKSVRLTACALTLASLAGVQSAVAEAAPESTAPASVSSGDAATTSPAPPRPRPDPKFDIEAFDVDGNTLLNNTAIESAVYPFMGPDRGRDDVAGARDALEKAYRAQGYPTVVVEVPQQDARTGVVKLHVVEIPVGRLRVVGSRYNLPSRIREQMPSLAEGKVPNFTRAQAELAEANRLPEMQVTPLERKGRAPGTVDVDLKVKDSLPLHASVALNNDHAQNTSQLRTIAAASYGDLWQLGHTISGTAILAPENLKNSEVFIGSYTLPLWQTPWTLIFNGTVSNSNVQALAGAGVIGNGFDVSATGSLQLPAWDDFSQTLNLALNFKHSINDLGFANLPPAGCNQLPDAFHVSRTCVDYWPVTASYSLDRASSDETISATTTFTFGTRGFGSGANSFFTNRAFARSNFVKFNLDTAYVHALPFDTRLSVTISGQLTDQALIPSEEFSAGGLNSLRGYLQSEALGDDGFFADVELISPSVAPFFIDHAGQDIKDLMTGALDDWRFYIFSDSAAAWVLDRLPDQRSVFPLMSIGAGSRMSFLSHFTGNVVMGMPMRNGTATKAWHPSIQFSATTEF